MKLIIFNNKCYLNNDETIRIAKELEKYNKKNEIVLLPNLIYLSELKNTKVKLGAQNFYSYNYGTYTGEVCLESLKDLNINYTLIGHPERLNLNLDSYTIARDKLFRSLNSGFKTILCIGKDNSERIIKKELKFYLSGLEYNTFKNLIIAFEPLVDEVDLVEINYIKDKVKNYIKKTYEEDITFIYGGLVDKDNINDILDITDGVIIGKNSTSADEVISILKQVK